VIEFLPPRADAFGLSDTADFIGVDGDPDEVFDDEPPRSRWLTAIAVLGVTGFLAGGVIAAEPWSGDAATPPATTVPPTTAPSPTTSTEPLELLPPGVILEPAGWLPATSARFQLNGAGSQPRAVEQGDAFALWASPNASRTTGRWVAVDARFPGERDMVRDATPIEVAGAPALLFESVDGVVEVLVRRTAVGSPFAVTAFGLGLDQLLAVVAGVRVTEDEVVITDDSLIGPGGPLDGLTAVVEGAPQWSPYWLQSYGPQAWSGFGDPSSSRWIQVGVAGLAIDNILIDEFLLRRPIDADLLERADRSRLAELSAGGRPVELFTSTADEGIVGASWFDGQGNEVMAAGTASVSELLQFVADLEPATAADWKDAVLGDHPDPGDERPTEIGGSTTGDWTAQVGNGWFWIGDNSSGVSQAWQPPSGPDVTTYRSFDRAYVMITNTWPNDGRQVRITQPSGTQDATLVQIGDSPFYAVALRIEAAEPFELTWLDLAEQPVLDN